MRTRRFLLVTAALSTIAAANGCKKDTIEGLPGNPKGMTYDPEAGTWVVPPPPPAVDAAPPVADPPDAAAPPPPPPPPPPASVHAPKRIPPPGNPKGSRYDAGPKIDL